jgi:pimeloyl-ACP methyl ester carboxylesterase
MIRRFAAVALCLPFALARDAAAQADSLAAPGRHRVAVSSTADRSVQPSYLYVPPKLPPGAARYPLAVVLHTWSYDLEQRFPDVEAEAAARGWLLLQPNFRGRNDHPEACGSPLAQQDILDAVAWVRRHYAVDDARIYLLGRSGGGHMTMLMAARHPGIWAGASAWVGIYDLADWYAAHVNDDYGRMMRGCLGGSPAEDGAAAGAARARSPRTYLKPRLGVPLDLAAGRSDSVVSPTHTLRAFQAIAPGVVSDLEIQQLLAPGPGLAAPAPTDTAADPVLARRIFLRRTSGLSRVTIFDGEHEWLAGAAMAWLSAHQKPPRSRRSRRVSAHSLPNESLQLTNGASFRSRPELQWRAFAAELRR